MPGMWRNGGRMSYPRVLERDSNGREILWQCSDCGKPFDLGWGSQCNQCIRDEKRHRELLKAITESRQTNLIRREQ